MRKGRLLILVLLLAVLMATLCACAKEDDAPALDVRGTWVAEYDYDGHHFRQVLEFADDTYVLSIYQDDAELSKAQVQKGTYGTNSKKVVLEEDETKLFTNLKYDNGKLRNNDLVVFERQD